MTPVPRIGRIRGRRPQSPAVDAAQSGAKTSSPANVDNLWRAYDLAQRHYEIDLQLFATRMNLFLLIQSGLVAVVTGVAGSGKSNPLVNRPALASFGLALAIAWLFAAISSYTWIKTWRAHMLQLSKDANIPASAAQFKHSARRDVHAKFYSKQILWRQLEHFTWFVRPTLIICCLPLLFIGGWIYLGWYA